MFNIILAFIRAQTLIASLVMGVAIFMTGDYILLGLVIIIFVNNVDLLLRDLKEICKNLG